MDIDELLAHSAPPGVDRTPELMEARRLLAADAERQSRGSRRTRRFAVAAGASAAILGLGAAAATGSGPSWVPWTTGEGSTCTMRFAAKPHDLSEGAPLELEYGQPLEDGPAELRAAVDEANRFLATYDLESVDEAAAIRGFLKEQDAAIASQPDPAEQQRRLIGSELALAAVGRVVGQDLDAHLAAMGLPEGAQQVSLWMSWTCQ